MRRDTHDQGGSAVVGETRPVALPRLRPHDVEVWRVALDEQPDDVVARLRQRLSGDEEERAASFYFERDRRRFIVCRGVLRVLLGRYLGCGPDEVVFQYGPNGKPELVTAGGETIHFNVAHSDGLALCAFTKAGEIGVDVERIRDLPDWQYIASTCFSPSERRRVATAGSDQQRTEFFRAWTRQEALLKARGLGLGADARLGPAATVHGYADPAPAVLSEGDNPAFRVSPSRVRIYPLGVAADFAAAVAVTTAAHWLTFYAWDHDYWRGHRRTLRHGRRIRLETTTQEELQFL